MLVPTSDLHTITSQLANVSECFRNKKVLVTGSSGFIGNWLSHGLSHLSMSLGLQIELVFLSRKIDDDFKKSISRYGNKKNTFIEADLSSDNLFQFKALNNLDFVFHTATTLTNLEAQISTSVAGFAVSGTSNLIDVIKYSQKPPVFIHLSSGAVYGHHSSEPISISENTELKKTESLSSYGSTKREIEELVTAASKAGIVIGSNPRLFSFFGPFLPLDAHFAIGNFIGKAINGNDIQLTGNPNSSRSYLYAGDLVRKLILLSIRPTSRTIHIGSDNRISMLALASTVRGIINDEIEVKLTDLSVKANHYVPSVKRSNEYLEDYSEVSLIEGLIIWKQWLLEEK